MASSTSGPKVEVDPIPSGEAAQIDTITALTKKQLDRRYKDSPPFLRGVHPKDHGCVEAIFTVSEKLDAKYRVGVFKKPGAKFRAAIRFSNASVTVFDDSPLEATPAGVQMRMHGSRGMAIKLYDVGGERLVPKDGEDTQDFLMINQPVFAFANVEDYEALSKAIELDDTKAADFFARLFPPFVDPVVARAKRSRAIIGQVKSPAAAPPPQPAFAFQPPPLSPLDNTYFSAAPFLFGKGRVMKFAARPVNPVTGELGDAINDPHYLRNALRKRMAEAKGKDICFDFQVQVRTAEALVGNIETEIENMCTEWKDEYVTVARITIPPQDVSSPERQKFCEALVYTPWHGLADHRPLGGINRMRRKVYEASADKRGCLVSPSLPPAQKKGLLGTVLEAVGGKRPGGKAK